MIRRWFELAVGGIVTAILSQQGAEERDFASVGGFVLHQHGRMPDFLRWPLTLVTLAFDSYPCLMRGRLFHSLDLTQRANFLQSWKHSRLGVQRDFVRFYESLTVFGWQAEQHGDASSA